MVRDCAKQSGGDLEIDSTMGQDTCIRIVLPLSRGSAGAHEAPGRMLHRSNAECTVMASGPAACNQVGASSLSCRSWPADDGNDPQVRPRVQEQAAGVARAGPLGNEVDVLLTVGERHQQVRPAQAGGEDLDDQRLPGRLASPCGS